MEYQLGQTIRVGNIKYEDRGSHHYVTKPMAKLSGQVGTIISRERYDMDRKIRYEIKVGNETFLWFEDTWLLPHMLDNRSI